MKRLILIILAIFLTAGIFSCGDGIDAFAPLDSASGEPPFLTGSVHLQNMTTHDGVRVELEDINTSIVTGKDGSFTLIENMAEGDWTVRASYPYFSQAVQTFSVKNGKPTEELDTIPLTQKVAFEVTTDLPSYMAGETAKVTMIATNVSDEPVTLSSTSSPQVALALAKDGQTVLGSLLPGDDPTPSEITLYPDEPYQVEISWNVDSTELEPGSYDLYVVLTDNVNFPHYFSTEEELLGKFNSTLYDKLPSVSIDLE